MRRPSTTPRQDVGADGPGRGRDRRVLVTGASSGLGRATVAALDEDGWRVWAGVRDHAAVQTVHDDHEGRVRPLRFDLRNAAEVDRAADEVLDEGPLDGLVHVAGAAAPAPLETVASDTMGDLLSINVLGPLRLTQRLLPALRTAREVNGEARMIFIGSLITRVPLPMFGPYGTSKHALVGLTEALRAELAPERIRVSLLEPGVCSTRIWLRAHDQAQGLLDDAPGSERLRGLRLAAPLVALLAHRYGSEPSRVAAAVLRCLDRPWPTPRRVVPGSARPIAAIAALLPARVRNAGASMIATEPGAAGLRGLTEFLLRRRPARDPSDRGRRQATRQGIRDA